MLFKEKRISFRAQSQQSYETSSDHSNFTTSLQLRLSPVFSGVAAGHHPVLSAHQPVSPLTAEASRAPSPVLRAGRTQGWMITAHLHCLPSAHLPDTMFNTLLLCPWGPHSHPARESMLYLSQQMRKRAYDNLGNFFSRVSKGNRISVEVILFTIFLKKYLFFPKLVFISILYEEDGTYRHMCHWVVEIHFLDKPVFPRKPVLQDIGGSRYFLKLKTVG